MPKETETLRAPAIVTVQVFPDADAQPDQNASLEYASGDAVSVTTAAGEVFGTLAVHPAVEPVVQEIPPPVTVPLPAPEGVTVSAYAAGAKLAVTDRAYDIATVQVLPDTESQPVQLENSEVASAAATSVTRVTGAVFGTGSVQPAVEPVVQAREVPLAVTVPFPAPPVRTVRR
jgi:hypothetical protein